MSTVTPPRGSTDPGADPGAAAERAAAELDGVIGSGGLFGVRRLLTRSNLVALAIGIGVIVVLVLFGGGDRRFDITGTGEGKFDWGFFWELVPDFAVALWVTVQGTIGGFVVAVVLGLAFAVLRRNRFTVAGVRVVSLPTAFVIEFIRSTPLLVQLYFLYFALPEAPDFDIGPISNTLDPLPALIIGLGIHYATYASEAYRAGLESVPRGQWEAATAMNLGSGTKWFRVILPQAIPAALPALGNNLIAAFKDAPMGFAIQVTGVMFFYTTVARGTFRQVETITLVGIGFLLVSIPSAWLIRRLEARVAYERTH